MNKKIKLVILALFAVNYIVAPLPQALAQTGGQRANAANGGVLLASGEGSAGIKPFNESEFVTVEKVKEMPESVRKALGELLISDAGGPFNATCCVDPSKPVPMTRLIFAACSKTICLMHFEKGGIAHIFKVACYSLVDEGGKPLSVAELLWQSNVGPNKLADLSALNTMIRSGSVKKAGPNDF